MMASHMSNNHTPPDEHASSSRTRSEPLQLDWQDAERPTLAIVQAVADLREADPESLPPLYDSINPEALEELLMRDHPSAQDGTVITFSYADCTVTVGADGELRIQDELAELS